MLREALIPYFEPLENSHILYLTAKSRSATPLNNFHNIVRNYYNKLDSFSEISKILKVIQYADYTDIIFDFNKPSIADIDPTTTENFLGMTYPEEGRIYISANRNEAELLGTLAHEFTHFAMQLLYKNKANPYVYLDNKEKTLLKLELDKIIDDAKKNNPIFNDKIDKSIRIVIEGYSEEDYAAELIALFPEILATHEKENKLNFLSKKIPLLINYYDKYILPDCDNFIAENYLINPRNNIRLLNQYVGEVNDIIKSRVRFNQKILYKDFLQDTGSINIKHKNIFFISTANVLLSRINVFQSLQGSNYYKFHDRFIFVKYEQFEKLSTEIIAAFKAGDKGLLIITEPIANRLLPSLQNLAETINSKPDKRIIFITPEDNLDQLYATLEAANLDEKHVTKQDEDYTWDMLTSNTQKRLLKKYVLFQGKEVPLNTLLVRKVIDTPEVPVKAKNVASGNQNSRASISHSEENKSIFSIDNLTPALPAGSLEKSSPLQEQPVTVDEIIEAPLTTLIDPTTLIALVDNKDITIGNALPAVSDDDHYIERTFNHHRIIQWDFLETANNKQSIIAISGNNVQFNLRKKAHNNFHRFTEIDSEQAPTGSLIILNENFHLSAKEQFIQLGQQYPDQDIHWLELQNGKLFWKQTQGRLALLKQFIDYSYSQFYSEGAAIEIATDQKTMVLADTAGMGKTTLFTHLAHEIKKTTPHSWVIKLNLNDHIEKLKDQENSGNTEFKESDQAIEFLSDKLLNFETTLEKNVFKDRLQYTGDIVLLFDNFDAIAPLHQQTGINFFKALTKTKLGSLWISTRPHLQATLEEALGVISYSLQPFSKEEAVSFLIKQWQCTVNLSENTVSETTSKIAIYANALIKKFNQSIKEYNALFTSSPLQIEMLSTIFNEKMQQFLVSSTMSPTFNERFNLLELYKNFIERKYTLYQTEQLKISATNSNAPELFQAALVTIRQAHQQLALQNLFPEKKILSLEPQNAWTNEALARIGLIEIVNNRVSFIHPTFAEYFVTDFVIDQLSKPLPNSLLTDFLLTDILIKPEQQVIRAFLNNHLTQRLSISVSIDDQGIFSSLWEPGEERDTFLRETPLHVAALEKNSAITAFLIDHSTDPFLKRWLPATNYYGNTALHQAVSVQDQASIEKIIQRSASLNILDNLTLAANKEGITVLHRAARSNNVMLAQLLWQPLTPATRTTLIMKENISGKSALHIAVLFGNLQMVEWLLTLDSGRTHYQLVTATDHYGRTVLHDALLLSNSKTSIVQQILKGLSSAEQLALIKTVDQEGRNSLHEAARYGNKEIIELLLEPLDINARNALILTLDQAGKNVLHQAAEWGQLDVVQYLFNSVDAATQRTLLTSKDKAGHSVLDLAVKNSHHALVQQLRINLVKANLEAVTLQIGNIGLELANTAAINSRCRRHLGQCGSNSEKHFSYDPLEEKSVASIQAQSAKLYAQLTMMAAVQEQPENFPATKLNDMVTYNTHVGTLSQKGVHNLSPREQKLLTDHYQQAQAFFDTYPHTTLLQPLAADAVVEPVAGQSWLLDNSRYSLLVLFDGQHYHLYSTDFNYQQRFQTKTGLTFSDIEAFARAFFLWRSGSIHYSLSNLKSPLEAAVLNRLKNAPFWQPDTVLPDHLLPASEQPSSIAELPTAVVRELFYLNQKTPDPTALKTNFFQQPDSNIQLRVDQLHTQLPNLNEKQRQALTKLVKEHQWSAAADIPDGLPEADQPLLEAYKNQVMAALKQGDDLTQQELSDLSWQVLREHLDSHPDTASLPANLKEQAFNNLKTLQASTSQKSWAKEMATQSLFFLPEFIRTANTGHTENLRNMGGMLIGDTIANHAYSHLVNRLEPLLSTQRAALLKKLPVTSPVFKIFTLYSIVELHQQLDSLPPDSPQRSEIKHQLNEQYFTVLLMTLEVVFGVELTPLWLVQFVEQSISGASDFRRVTALF